MKNAIIFPLAFLLVLGRFNPADAQTDTLEYATFEFCFTGADTANHEFANDFHIEFEDTTQIVAETVAGGRKVVAGKWGTFSNKFSKIHHFPPKRPDDENPHYGEQGRIKRGECIRLQFRGRKFPKIKSWNWTHNGAVIGNHSDKDATMINAKPANGQNNAMISTSPNVPGWNRVPLTGAAAKTAAAAPPPRFNVGLTGSLPLGDLVPRQISFADLQNAAFTPGVAEQLFEKLSGEFLIGNPSGQPQNRLEMSGQTQAMPGLQLGVRLGGRFELQAAARHFRAEWSGVFPVTVFPHDGQSIPKTLEGSANASVSGVLIDVGTVFFISGRGVVRPFLKGGARAQMPLSDSNDVEIAGIALPVEKEQVESAFSAFGGAGIRLHFLKNAYADAACSYGRLADGDYHPSLEFSIGWGF